VQPVYQASELKVQVLPEPMQRQESALLHKPIVFRTPA